MATTTVELGGNRTGISTSGELSEHMVEGTREFLPNLPGDEREIARARGDYAKDSDPIGSVPPPPTLKGMMKTAKQALGGEHPALLIDKLGERLSFERTGVRLYEALLSKHDAYGSFDKGPMRADIENILMQELGHFRLLEESLRKLGADPTVMTPSADVAATLSKGVIEVLVDPRTNFVQGLEAVLVAELVDNDCWHVIAQLTEQAGEDELAARFREAEIRELEHLTRVRSWLAAAQDRPAAGMAAEAVLTSP